MLKFINEIDQSLVIYQEYGVPETTVLENGIVIPNGSLCVDKLNQEIYLLIDGSWTLVTDNTLLSNTTRQTINITTSDVTSYENLAFYQASASKYYTSSYNGSDELSIILPDVIGNSGKWFVVEDSLGLTININKKTSEYGSLHKTLYAVGSVGKITKTYFYCDGVKWRIAHSFFPAVSTKIEGTYYEFVMANGTDVENAQELQDAYDKAKLKSIITYSPISIPIPWTGFTVSSGQMSVYAGMMSYLPILVVGQQYNIILNNVQYNATVNSSFQWSLGLTNITAPDGSYNTLSILFPTIKKSKVIVSPGYFNFSSNFLVDTNYVDVVSLDGNRSIIFNGTGTVNITANNVFIKGFDVVDKNFTIATNLNKLVVENCKGGEYSFGGGSGAKTINGTFTDCEGGDYSFGISGTASGIFTNCKGGQYSFGYQGTASGIFTNCKGGDSSFGSYGTASGIFTDCEGGNYSLGYYGTASGTFNNCIGAMSSFGGFGTASGIFTDCVGSYYNFGGNGTASGVFNNCIGNNNSFAFNGTLSGKLYYCRLIEGVFRTVSESGRTYYCVDGDGNTNNQ
jgi:hypothetical protein